MTNNNIQNKRWVCNNYSYSRSRRTVCLRFSVCIGIQYWFIFSIVTVTVLLVEEVLLPSMDHFQRDRQNTSTVNQFYKCSDKIWKISLLEHTFCEGWIIWICCQGSAKIILLSHKNRCHTNILPISYDQQTTGKLKL